MGDLSLLSCPFLHSFIHRYIFYAFGYNPVLLYLVAQIVPALSMEAMKLF